MLLRVVLVAQAGEDFTNPPGRDLLASSEHTFADLARAIDRAFARWDISHLHEFQLADGTRIASVDEDETDEAALDDTIETLGRLRGRRGTSFGYVFDFGAGWGHRCTVLRDALDPREELGAIPKEITPVFGWGTIPDQYGRIAPDADDPTLE